MSLKEASSGQDLDQSRAGSSKILSRRFTDVDQLTGFLAYNQMQMTMLIPQLCAMITRDCSFVQLTSCTMHHKYLNLVNQSNQFQYTKQSNLTTVAR
ncbi:MAG: hypothetical protein F6K31_05795 [Symploca sp. SIO2G7]|nr:hypothetical protein [Symploca sp. SIO2G7]